MALRNILPDSDPALRKVCRPVTDFNPRLHTLLDDMAETMREAAGVGLAAPQVGVLRRVVVVDVGEGLIELVNPQIIQTEDSQVGEEACLSVKGRRGIVERPNKVTVRAQDRDGNPFEVSGEEFLARAFCHELDHLDGRLYTDIMIREVFNEPDDTEEQVP
jgi:peptide deformylase